MFVQSYSQTNGEEQRVFDNSQAGIWIDTSDKFQGEKFRILQCFAGSLNRSIPVITSSPLPVSVVCHLQESSGEMCHLCG